MDAISFSKAKKAQQKANSVQAQLDQAIASGNQLAETQQARVDVSGTTHTTLKARADSDYTTLTNRTNTLDTRIAVVESTGGAKGDKGDPGQGVPTGGTQGQILAKRSSANHDTEWVDYSGSGGGGSIQSLKFDDKRLVYAICYHNEDPTNMIKLFQRQGFSFIWASELSDYLDGKNDIPHKSVLLTYDDSHLGNWGAIPKAIALGVKTTLYVISGYVDGEPGVNMAAGNDPMTWDQVRSLYSSGLVELGNHTRYHTDLRAIPTATRKADLQHVQNRIQAETGVAPKTIAYPYGWANSAVYEDCKAVGLKMGFHFHPAMSTKISHITDNRFTYNRLANYISLFESYYTDVFYHYANDIIGGRNKDNKLDYWATTTGNLLKYEEDGHIMVLDKVGKPVAHSITCTDYFSVRPSDEISFDGSFYLQTWGSSPTDGTAKTGFKWLEYDKDKVLVREVPLYEYNNWGGTAPIDAGVPIKLHDSTRFLRFQIYGNASYVGQTKLRNLSVRRWGLR